jgi:peptidoglycan/LPS O-acetylase OafA/YrhL
MQLGTPLRSGSRQRLLFLDGLRGLAALAVVGYHFYARSPLADSLGPVLPRWIDLALRNGQMGVDVFFVLSGFVIAMSIDGAKITRGYVGRFALRRSIRLDPPYWVTLAIASVLLFVAHRPITAGQVVAHVFYLQGIIGYPQIVSMFWTLCYEIQFYLVLVLFVALAQRFGRGMCWLVAILPFAVSVLLLAAGANTHGLFLDWWYAFALGTATYGMMTRRLPIWAWIGILLIVPLAAPTNLHTPATAASALLIGSVGLAGRLSRWSGGPVVQYFGRISYSLYLIHFVGNTIAKYGGARHPAPLEAVGWLIAATISSIIAAHGLHVIVEQPAHRWSKRIPLESRPREPEPANRVAESAAVLET